MRYAEVAVDCPVDRPETFSYSVPDHLDVSPGDVVQVPFGPRTVKGVVFEVGKPPKVEHTRDIVRVADGGPFIPSHGLSLARWVASHYRSTLFAAAASMLPPGGINRLRVWITETGVTPRPLTALRTREQRAMNYVAEQGRVTRESVGRKLGRGGIEVVDRLVRRGFLQSAYSWESPTVRAKYRDVVALAVSAQDAEDAAKDFEGGRSARQGELLNWLLSGNGRETRSDLARRFGQHAVRATLDKGLTKLQRIQIERDPLEGYVVQERFPPDLTGDQSVAVAAIQDALLGGDVSSSDNLDAGKPFLLYGVTGSGKTEVYMSAADACIRAGKRVLVLVPEIAMTPQTLERFASRFPGKIALQHSGLPAGQRYDQWWRIRRGDYPIVLGSRGAVFTPIDNLGLVVIDEEHEWTYKQPDMSPRYHARAVAERLCRLTGAVLVMGSATPDTATYRRAQRDQVRLLSLPRRIISGEADRPSNGRDNRAEVRLVDMREELRAGHAEILSRPLIDEMKSSLNSGGRVILFINRRGTASFVQCRDCGAIRSCRRCDTSLTFHRSADPATADQLVCHYCNYRIQARRTCRECGGSQIRRLSPGTQALMDAVAAYFPRTGAIRWDSDSARTARDHARIVEEFEKGEARVLVGTQMVAKGLDVPSVTLVGVVSADTGLAIPDYRAGERAFQILAQVAGRAGRGPRGGNVVIQTFQPDHYAIRAAAAQDYRMFYDTEIRMRQNLANPPFTKLIRLTCSSHDREFAHAAAMTKVDFLKIERTNRGLTDTVVTGPTPAYPLRVRDMYRWHVVLKGPRPERLLDASPVGEGWVVDVDPVSLA